MGAWPRDIEAIINASKEPQTRAAWEVVRDLFATQERFNVDFEQRIKALENRIGRIEARVPQAR